MCSGTPGPVGRPAMQVTCCIMCRSSTSCAGPLSLQSPNTPGNVRVATTPEPACYHQNIIQNSRGRPHALSTAPRRRVWNKRWRLRSQGACQKMEQCTLGNGSSSAPGQCLHCPSACQPTRLQPGISPDCNIGPSSGLGLLRFRCSSAAAATSRLPAQTGLIGPIPEPASRVAISWATALFRLQAEHLTSVLAFSMAGEDNKKARPSCRGPGFSLVDRHVSIASPWVASRPVACGNQIDKIFSFMIISMLRFKSVVPTSLHKALAFGIKRLD